MSPRVQPCVVNEITVPMWSSRVEKARSQDADWELVERWVSRGDACAFQRLVELHQAYVFRIALSVLGPGFESDAQDVAQDVFLRAAEHLRHFRGESRLRTWLHRLAVNMAINCRRRPRWRKPHVDAALLERRPSPACLDDDPYLSTAAAERRRAVHEALDALPDSVRTVIHLHYWLDLPVAAIASMLAMPIGTVKSHLHRGRRMLFTAMTAAGAVREVLPGTRCVPSGVVAARARSPHSRRVGRCNGVATGLA